MPSAGREVLFGLSHCDWAFDQSSRWFLPRCLASLKAIASQFDLTGAIAQLRGLLSQGRLRLGQKAMAFGIRLGFQSLLCSWLAFLDVESVAWFRYGSLSSPAEHVVIGRCGCRDGTT